MLMHAVVAHLFSLLLMLHFIHLLAYSSVDGHLRSFCLELLRALIVICNYWYI